MASGGAAGLLVVKIMTRLCLTSLAVIPLVTRGRAKMQEMVTPSLTRSTDPETDDHVGVITVMPRCGASVGN